MKTLSFEKYLAQSDDIVSKNQLSIKGSVFLVLAIAFGLLTIKVPGIAMPTISILLLIPAIVYLINERQTAFALSTQCKIHESFFYFSRNDVPNMKKALETGNFKDIASIPLCSSDVSGTRIDSLISKDKNLIVVQILEYKPFEYVPVGPIFEFKNEQAQALTAALQR